MSYKSPNVEGDWSHYWHNFSNGKTPSSTILHPDFSANLKNTDIVLDIGCGYGRITSLLAEKSHTVIGVDINKDEVLHATLNNAAANIAYGVMSGTELGFEDQSFDKVTLLGVLGGVGLSMRDDILDEAYRVLKPGGQIYSSEFAMKPKGRRYARGLRETGENGIMLAYHDGKHTNDVKFVGKHFYPSELSSLMSDHGFNTLKVRNPRVPLRSHTNQGRFVRKMVCVWGSKPTAAS